MVLCPNLHTSISFMILIMCIKQLAFCLTLIMIRYWLRVMLSSWFLPYLSLSDALVLCFALNFCFDLHFTSLDFGPRPRRVEVAHQTCACVIRPNPRITSTNWSYWSPRRAIARAKAHTLTSSPVLCCAVLCSDIDSDGWLHRLHCTTCTRRPLAHTMLTRKCAVHMLPQLTSLQTWVE